MQDDKIQQVENAPEKEISTTPVNETESKDVASGQENKKPKSEHEQIDLMDLLFPGKTKEVRDLTGEEWVTYRQKMLVLERVEARGGSVINYLKILETDEAERAIVGLKKEDKVWNAATIFRWKTKKDDAVALSKTCGGIGRHAAMPNWVICYTLDYLESKAKSRPIKVWEGLKDLGNQCGYDIPSYGRISRFIKAIKSYGGIQDMLQTVKNGKYHSQYAMLFGNLYTYSNERWQTDATRLPIWLLNEKATKAYQPWLLLTVDCASGLPMGWTIPDWKSVEDEDDVLRGNDANANDVISHLKECMLPKSDLAYWGGKPTFLQSDNGAVYKSQNFRDVANELGINLRNSPPYCPSANGSIERLNQTVKQGFADKFADYLVKKKHYTQKRPLGGGLDSLRRKFNDFILEFANTHKRNGCEETLFESWRSNLRTAEEAFANKEEVEAKCLHYGTFPITREGVLVKGVHFRDVEGILEPSQTGKKDPTVLVRYNPDGEPKIAIARIANRDVRMVRNIKAEKEMMEACKHAQWVKKDSLTKLLKEVKRSSQLSAKNHSPYAVEDMKNQPEATTKKKSSHGGPPLTAPKKIVIPKIIKYPSK